MARYNVYVVELDPRILKENRKFAAENPQYIPGKPCVYVGRTGLTPEKRFENHKSGHRSSKLVKEYGLWLRPRLYKKYNPMTWEEVQPREKDLADKLRSRGYAVWQR